MRSDVNSQVQILLSVQGLRDEAQEASWQKSYEAAHIVGTARNACLTGGMNTPGKW